jgi:Ku protein
MRERRVQGLTPAIASSRFFVVGKLRSAVPILARWIRLVPEIPMAPRSFWKGYLTLSFVNCPVAMTPETTEIEKVRFHILNRKTGNRVVSQYVDAVSGKRADEDDEVKGYPPGEHDYVVLEDDELEAVNLESTRTIDIDMFVPADSIEWIWYDKPHYLTPRSSRRGGFFGDP